MISIYTLAHKRPDFIEYQHESLLKYLKDDYEYIVLNNGTIVNDHTGKEIQTICNNRKIKCINIEKDESLIKHYDEDADNIRRGFRVFDNNKKYQTANVACAYPLVWAQKHIFSNSTNNICVLDSDMFMIKEDNFNKHLNDKDFMFIPYRTQHIHFPWNAIFLINKHCPDRHEINWWCGMVDGIPVDVGGYSSIYLKNHPNLKIGLIQPQIIEDDESLNFHPSNFEYLQLSENGNKSILHYRSGSNWNKMSNEYHYNKTLWLKKQIGL